MPEIYRKRCATCGASLGKIEIIKVPQLNVRGKPFTVTHINTFLLCNALPNTFYQDSNGALQSPPAGLEVQKRYRCGLWYARFPKS